MRLRGLSPATITQRRRSLNRLARSLGKPLLDVTEADLTAWQEGLVGSPRYLANQLANCASFYAWACDTAEVIPTNPARRLVRPKVPKGIPRPMAEERLSMAIAGAPVDVRCWLVLGAYAGLRAGEMARLQRQDVLDTAEPPVLIVNGKGGKQRIVPASPRVLFELRAYGMPSRGYIFRRRDTRPGPPSPARVSQLVNGYLHDIGIEDTGHATRHRFGTRAYQRSRDIRMVQDLLGHSDPGTTAGYAAFAAEAAAAIVASLDDTPPVRV
jgi:integrase/recombinase XerC